MVEVINTVETIDAVPHNSAARRSLYAARVKIHPKRGSGYFRNLKWLVMAVTLGIYVTPWLRWDRGLMRLTRLCLLIWRTGVSIFSSSKSGRRNLFVAGLLIMAGNGLFLVIHSGPRLVRIPSAKRLD
jgi:hypothetical protein